MLACISTQHQHDKLRNAMLPLNGQLGWTHIASKSIYVTLPLYVCRGLRHHCLTASDIHIAACGLGLCPTGYLPVQYPILLLCLLKWSDLAPSVNALIDSVTSK
jgi:hypothetical protein